MYPGECSILILHTIFLVMAQNPLQKLFLYFSFQHLFNSFVYTYITVSSISSMCVCVCVCVCVHMHVREWSIKMESSTLC